MASALLLFLLPLTHLAEKETTKMLGLGGRRTSEGVAEFATCEDFQTIFTEYMCSLHALAFLLTADNEKAEACFVAGLEDSVEGTVVFREWAHSWARRAIIKNAIRLISPVPQQSCDVLTGEPRELAWQPGEAPIEAIMKLPAFERFVFVISVLEDHTLSDTAILLGCTNSQLLPARSNAVRRLAAELPEAHPHGQRSTTKNQACALDHA